LKPWGRKGTVEKDREGDLAVHQVLCLYRELPDLATASSAARRSLPGEARGSPSELHVHLIRFAHIADSCVNCGSVRTLCHGYTKRTLHASQQVELEKMFGMYPGISMELPLLALVEEKEERDRLAATGSDRSSISSSKTALLNFFSSSAERALIRWV